MCQLANVPMCQLGKRLRDWKVFNEGGLMCQLANVPIGEETDRLKVFFDRKN